MYAVLALLCWTVSSVKSDCYSCYVPHCYRCSCSIVHCYECKPGYTVSYLGDSCHYDGYTPYSPSYGPTPSIYDDEEDEEDDGSRVSFIGFLVLTACLLAVICAIARCRLRQIRAAYAPQPIAYIPHGFQGQNYPSAHPIVPYYGQGRYADLGSSTGLPTYAPLHNDPTTTSSDSSGEKPREAAYVVGPDGELQVGVGG